MSFLIDTSVLTRIADRSATLRKAAVQSVRTLHDRGEGLKLTAQNLVEFRNVATRPKKLNGLGFSTAEAETEAAVFEAIFPLLPETPDVHPAWKALVMALGVVGKQVHDARLVAVCHVHRVTHVLTFNVGHFTRLAAFGPGLTVVDPTTV